MSGHKPTAIRPVTASPVPYSSVVGQAVKLQTNSGRVVGQLLFVGFDLEAAELGVLAEQVAGLMNAGRLELRAPA